MALTGNDQLLPELWIQIFSMLSSHDIKATRLACKAFSDLSSSFLMKRAYFALRPRTMDVLYQIARHPIFSKTVTELIYDITEVRRLRLDEGWYKSEKGDELRDGFTEACELYTAQEASKESGDGRACLEFAFSHMPRLQTVLCLDWTQIVQLLLDEDEPKPFAYLHMRDKWWVDVEDDAAVVHAEWARCWYTRKGPMVWDRMNPHLFALRWVQEITKYGPIAQVKTVFHAAYEAKATISNFSYQYFTRTGQQYGVLSHIRAWSLQELNVSRWVFQNLRHFSAGLYNFRKWPEEPPSADILGELLSTAPHLETFGLFTSVMPDGLIHRILGTTRWPCIRSIQLVGMHVDARVLQAFLQRNAATLKEVDISCVTVPPDGRSEQIADIMAQHLDLDGVRLGLQFLPSAHRGLGRGSMERNAIMVPMMEARVLHGKPNSLRLHAQPLEDSHFHAIAS